MDFRIRSDTSESGRIRQRPPDYSSRGVRLRLATLIALLGVSIIAMYEAGKPATWERMGFASQPQPAEADESNSLSGAAVLPEAQKDRGDFWKLQFQMLSLEDRKLLFQMIDERLRRKAFKGNAKSAKRLIEQIEIELEKLTESGQVETNASVASITQGLRLWIDAGVNAAAEENDDLDDEELRQVQDELDRSAFSLIEDRSSLGRSAESLAWMRSWRKLESLEGDARPTEVNIVELTGQPNAFRGQLVKISGTARGLEQIEVASKDLAFKNYYVLWIKPREMSRTPYCVYVRSLPDGFPEPKSTFENIEEPVSVNGIFFKLRSYVTTNDNIESCPLICAESLTWKPVSEQQASDSKWQPPFWMLTLFLIGMPIIAAWLALRVYRNTKVVPIQIRKNEQRTISENLQTMSADESIKSDRERVEALRRQLNEESDLP